MINQTVTIAADKRRNGRDRNDATRTVSFDEWQNVSFICRRVITLLVREEKRIVDKAQQIARVRVSKTDWSSQTELKGEWHVKISFLFNR